MIKNRLKISDSARALLTRMLQCGFLKSDTQTCLQPVHRAVAKSSDHFLNENSLSFRARWTVKNLHGEKSAYTHVI